MTILKTVKPYTYNRWIIWYINYNWIKIQQKRFIQKKNKLNFLRILLWKQDCFAIKHKIISFLIIGTCYKISISLWTSSFKGFIFTEINFYSFAKTTLVYWRNTFNLNIHCHRYDTEVNIHRQFIFIFVK